MALGRQSIYGAFGGKHELFVRSLERYAGKQVAFREILRRDGAGLAEIRQFMDAVVVYLDSGGRSCFLVRAALAQGDDRDVVVRCGRNQADLTDAFARALEGAKARKEIRPDTDVRSAALVLAAQVFGLNVMARNGSDAETLRLVARAAVDGLT